MEQKKINLPQAFYHILMDNEKNADAWWSDFYKENNKVKKLPIRLLKDCCSRGAKVVTSYNYKVPAREDIIVLACRWQWGIEKTNEVLLRVGYNALYSRSINDAIYIFLLKNNNSQVSKELVEHYRVLIKDKLAYKDYSVLDAEKCKDWNTFLEQYKGMTNTTDEDILEVCGLPKKTRDKTTKITPERDTIICMGAYAGFGAETVNVLLNTYGRLSLNKAAMEDAIWIYILGKGSKTPKAEFKKYSDELAKSAWSRFYEVFKTVTGLGDDQIVSECDVDKEELYCELPDREVLIMLCIMAGLGLEDTNAILSRKWEVVPRRQRDSKHRQYEVISEDGNLRDGIWEYLIKKGAEKPRREFAFIEKMLTGQEWGEFYISYKGLMGYTDEEIAEMLGLSDDVKKRSVTMSVTQSRDTVIKIAACGGFNIAMTNALIKSKGHRQQLGDSKPDKIWKFILKTGGSDKPGYDYERYEIVLNEGRPLTKRTLGTRLIDQTLMHVNTDAEDFIRAMGELDGVLKGAYDSLKVEVQNIWEEIMGEYPNELIEDTVANKETKCVYVNEAFKAAHEENIKKLNEHQPPDRMYLLALSIYGNLNLTQTNNLLEKARMEKLRIVGINDFESWYYLALIYCNCRYPHSFDEQIIQDEQARSYLRQMIRYMGEIKPSASEDVFFRDWLNRLMPHLIIYAGRAPTIVEVTKLIVPEAK